MIERRSVIIADVMSVSAELRVERAQPDAELARCASTVWNALHRSKDDLALDVAIGAHDFERGRTQPVLLSIDLYLVPGPPPEHDRLEAVFERDLEDTREIDLEKWRERPLRDKLKEAASSLLSYWL